MNKKLTPEQSAFAAENHYVLEKYMRSKRLNAGDYYDVLVFGYLEAVCNYFEHPELREQYPFEAIAKRVMNFDLIDYYRAMNRKKRKAQTVSYESSVSYGCSERPLEEMIGTPDVLEDDVEIKMLWEEIAAKLPYFQLNILRMRIEGYSDMEIAKRNSIPFNEFDGVLSGIRDSLSDICFA